MKKQKDVNFIIRKLEGNYPKASTSLSSADPLQLLIATILSAQCTDERVNKVTPSLFRKYKGACDFAKADPAKLQKEIKSTGFYKQKAKWIIGASKVICEQYGGDVPKSMEELTKLPGVARKTANVILGSAYNIISGIVVDTHVKRVSYRLGLTKEADPVKIEEDLTRVIPKNKWIWISHAIILHGRNICKAQRPVCSDCVLKKVCEFVK